MTLTIGAGRAGLRLEVKIKPDIRAGADKELAPDHALFDILKPCRFECIFNDRACFALYFLQMLVRAFIISENQLYERFVLEALPEGCGKCFDIFGHRLEVITTIFGMIKLCVSTADWT